MLLQPRSTESPGPIGGAPRSPYPMFVAPSLLSVVVSRCDDANIATSHRVRRCLVVSLSAIANTANRKLTHTLHSANNNATERESWRIAVVIVRNTKRPSSSLQSYGTREIIYNLIKRVRTHALKTNTHVQCKRMRLIPNLRTTAGRCVRKHAPHVRRCFIAPLRTVVVVRSHSTRLYAFVSHAFD